MKTLFHCQRVGSTQDKAKQLAKENFPEETVVLADKQTRSYGRMKKKWTADEGGLWLSLILRPEISPKQALKLSPIISIAINRVFKKQFKMKTKIKWPNDILYDNKKVVGILTEMSLVGKKVEWVIVGVGINANNTLPKKLTHTATTLKEITGSDVSIKDLFENVFDEIIKVYEKFLKRGFKPFVDEYNKSCALIGEEIKIQSEQINVVGKNKGINKDANLVIKTKDGIKKLNSCLSL
jgi:BirA family biotin operon repressor/biotin-[acetyl-CoA-carboxylase] ligase